MWQWHKMYVCLCVCLHVCVHICVSACIMNTWVYMCVHRHVCRAYLLTYYISISVLFCVCNCVCIICTYFLVGYVHRVFLYFCIYVCNVYGNVFTYESGADADAVKWKRVRDVVFVRYQDISWSWKAAFLTGLVFLFCKISHLRERCV